MSLRFSFTILYFFLPCSLLYGWLIVSLLGVGRLGDDIMPCATVTFDTDASANRCYRLPSPRWWGSSRCVYETLRLYDLNWNSVTLYIEPDHQEGAEVSNRDGTQPKPGTRWCGLRLTWLANCGCWIDVI